MDASQSITCPLSNNSPAGGTQWCDTVLDSRQKKAAEIVRLELESLPETVPLRRILVVTVTLPNPLPSRKNREELIARAISRLFKKHFAFGITIFDRSDTGRPHYHLIAVGPKSADYRGAFDFDAWEQFSFNEKRWFTSGRTNRHAQILMIDAAKVYVASAAPRLRAAWWFFRDETPRLGLGRMNALPVKNPVAFSKYFAKCITRVYQMNNPEDRGLRKVRFWGRYPRTVNRRFTRLTKNATRWRGKLAFCAHVLGFSDIGDFSKCFGPRWFIHLKGIIRTVPVTIALASLLTQNLPQWMEKKYLVRIRQIEVELIDRFDRYGRMDFENQA